MLGFDTSIWYSINTLSSAQSSPLYQIGVFNDWDTATENSASLPSNNNCASSDWP